MEHSLQKGQNHLPHSHLLTNPNIIGYPPIFKSFLPQTSRHLSLSLNVSKYFSLYKTLLWPNDEGYQGVLVLSTRQDKPKQFSMKYCFREDKNVYYQVKKLMVNRITRSMLFLFSIIFYFHKQIKIQHNHISNHLDPFIKNKHAELWLSDSSRHEYTIIAFYNHKEIETKMEIFAKNS